MSRYGFNVDKVEIVVGWDNPCRTFFGSTEVDGKPVVDTMLGMGQFNVRKVHLLESMIGFTIPPEISIKLLHDRDDGLMAPRSPLQETVGEIFGENG